MSPGGLLWTHTLCFVRTKRGGELPSADEVRRFALGRDLASPDENFGEAWHACLFNTCEISGEIGTMPYAVDGGTKWVNSTPPKATHCVLQIAGSGIHMDKTESFTFSDGINLQVIFGISLAATTGYTTEASIRYNYDARGYACGTHSSRCAAATLPVASSPTIQFTATGEPSQLDGRAGRRAGPPDPPGRRMLQQAAAAARQQEREHWRGMRARQDPR